MTGADIEVVVVTGIAFGPHTPSRLRFLYERGKLAPIDLPSFLRPCFPNSGTLQKVIVEDFLAAAVDRPKVPPEILISLRGDNACLEGFCCARPMMDVVAINTNDLDPQKRRGPNRLLLPIVPYLVTVQSLSESAANGTARAVLFDKISTQLIPSISAETFA